MSSALRSPLLPEVPTTSERGIPGFEASGWQGYFVPAQTPKEIIRLIHRATVKVLGSPDMREKLKTIGNDPVGSTPDEFEAKMIADVVKFAAVIKEAGIQVQN